MLSCEADGLCISFHLDVIIEIRTKKGKIFNVSLLNRIRAGARKKSRTTSRGFRQVLVARITVATTVQISSLIISMHLAGIEKIAVMSGMQTHAVRRNVKVNTSEARPLFVYLAFPVAKQMREIGLNQNIVKVQMVFECCRLV